MNDAELDFQEELRAAVAECRKLGYPPSRFLEMIHKSSPFDAVRTLLTKTNLSDGFITLYEKKRLDLTVEAIILKPKWRAHFTPSEIALARKRLADVHFRAPWDESDNAAPSACDEVEVLKQSLAASKGDRNAGKRIRDELRGLGHYGGLRQRQSDIDRGLARSTSVSTSSPQASRFVLPPIRDAQGLVERVRNLKGLPERNHEDVVKEFLVLLGHQQSAIVFQRGRMDICIVAGSNAPVAVFEVKRTIATESERTGARRQGMDYANQTGAMIVVLSDGDRYEVYDRRNGTNYDSMLRGKFQLTAFLASDSVCLDLLRPESLLGK